MLPVVLLVAVALACMLILRYLWVVSRPREHSLHKENIRTLIVLGSGGHTAEMLMLLDKFDRQRYSPRCYVVAATDAMSGSKALRMEQKWQQTDHPADFQVQVIPRSREVGQSYITSVGTTLYSAAFAAALVLRQRPSLVLVNGPGTCIPICAAAFMFRLLGLINTRLVYVESIARTRKLSLSGKILYLSRMADIVFVQWSELLSRYPRAQFAGRLY